MLAGALSQDTGWPASHIHIGQACVPLLPGRSLPHPPALVAPGVKKPTPQHLSGAGSARQLGPGPAQPAERHASARPTLAGGS